MIFIGIFIAITVEVLGVPVLPVALGLYLPLELSTTVMIGGGIRAFTDYLNKKKTGKSEDDAGAGVLFCSGLIAGEGLVGIILAVLAVIGLGDMIDLSGHLNTGMIGGIVLMILIIISVVIPALKKK